MMNTGCPITNKFPFFALANTPEGSNWQYAQFMYVLNHEQHTKTNHYAFSDQVCNQLTHALWRYIGDDFIPHPISLELIAALISDISITASRCTHKLTIFDLTGPKGISPVLPTKIVIQSRRIFLVFSAAMQTRFSQTRPAFSFCIKDQEAQLIRTTYFIFQMSLPGKMAIHKTAHHRMKQLEINHTNIGWPPRVAWSTKNVFSKISPDWGCDTFDYRFDSAKQIASAFIQLCSGVDYLLAKGVVHRDIKPDNLLFDGKTLRIIDLDFVHEIGQDTTLKGSLPYIPLSLCPKTRRDQINTENSITYIAIPEFEEIRDDVDVEIKANSKAKTCQTSKKLDYFAVARTLEVWIVLNHKILSENDVHNFKKIFKMIISNINTMDNLKAARKFAKSLWSGNGTSKNGRLRGTKVK